jgi:hypothetical protein
VVTDFQEFEFPEEEKPKFYKLPVVQPANN